MEEQNLISRGDGAILTTTHQSINIQSTRNATLTSKATTTHSAIVQVPASTTHRGSNIVESKEAAYLNALTWPPRSYACSFCRKEFRSAQALGGHMNVHRRDRARLRHQSPSKSTIALNHNLANHEHDNDHGHDHDHHIGVFQKKPREVPVNFPICPGFDGTMRQSEPRKRPVDGFHGGGSIVDAVKVMRRGSLSYGSHVWDLKKGRNGVRLDLEMGVVGDGSEDVDLELRLGFK